MRRPSSLLLDSIHQQSIKEDWLLHTSPSATHSFSVPYNSTLILRTSSSLTMMFGNKPLSSALVAMVTLSIAVSAALDPIEQSLFARDGQDF